MTRIKTIDLPFYDSCENVIESLEFNDTPAFKYLPNACSDSYKLAIAGKIVENEKYVALLLVDTYGDYQMPYVTTFNLNGKLLSKVGLFTLTGCGEDESFFADSRFVINKDLTINVHDSTANYERDSMGKIIEQSNVAKSEKYVLIIAEDGSVIKK